MSSTRKTPAKTPEPRLVPQPHGGALRTGGNPGNAGGGRPPNWLKDWCDDLLAKPETKQQVEEILADKSHPAFATMWKAVGDRGHGKPKESIDATVTQKLLVIRDVDDLESAG